MPNIHISVQGVKKQLEKISEEKAYGPHLIPARVLKETATEIAPIQAKIFQLSLDSGKLPSAWKDANVSCIKLNHIYVSTWLSKWSFLRDSVDLSGTRVV